MHYEAGSRQLFNILSYWRDDAADNKDSTISELEAYEALGRQPSMAAGRADLVRKIRLITRSKHANFEGIQQGSCLAILAAAPPFG